MRWISSSVVAAVLMFAGGCGSLAVDAQTTSRATDRIVGGSGYSGMPAVGALTYYGSLHCTGTLIGPRTVLTAAHCVDNMPANKMRFVIGANISNADYILPIASMRAHPSYDEYSIRNDIGVVTLVNDAPIAPMRVVDSMDASWRGTNLFFVGYGDTNGSSGAGAGKKRAVWMGISRIDGTTFRYDDPGKNTCTGDSGGPAFFEAADGSMLVAGVTSWGDWSCTQFGVDTRVDVYKDFLGIAPTLPPVQDACGGETFDGRCQGNSVIWCEGNQVNTVDCAQTVGGACVFDSTNDYFACSTDGTAAAQVDPCGGESWEGRCDGGSVIWCEENEVKSTSCSSQGLGCEWDGSNGYYNCG